MLTNLSNKRRTTGARKPRDGESGFTLLEMVVAMVVMMIGLLSLAQVLGFALSVSNRGRGVTNAKLLVVSVLEQMENLRNTGQLTYAQIANSTNVDNTGGAFLFGGFPAGYRSVSINPGTDGIYGTADDPTTASQVRTGFERKIEITEFVDTPNLKKIVVTLRYTDAAGAQRTLVGTSYLNNDARGNMLH